MLTNTIMFVLNPNCRTLLNSAENGFFFLIDSTWIRIVSVALTLTMTLQESAPLNAGEIPLPAAGTQVLKNGPSPSLPDIDVCQIRLQQTRSMLTLISLRNLQSRSQRH